MIIHVVRSGETLWTISRIYGVNYQEIAQINELPDPNRLVLGQALVIPTEEAATHIVQPGETLWSIANRYGISIQSIIQVNRIVNPNLIYPGTILIIPQRLRPEIEVNGYLANMQPNIVTSVGAYLTYLSPFSYQVQSNGDLTPLNDTAVLNAAASFGVAPLMVINNILDGEFNSDLAHTILASPSIQDRLITNILTVMNQKNYAGLNIDFEYVYPADRELYNSFLSRVAGRLRPLGYLISSALAPKYRADQPGLLYEAHDYQAHGEILDFVVIMTYEWGWSGGPPMAVAPLNEVRAVLNYALTEIPANKILMGMPLYGYDWTLPFVPGGPFARAISPQEAVRIALNNYAAIQYDQLAQSPYFYYYDSQQRQHVVWFEDARSVQAKYDLVKELNLRGVSYWVLTNSFPQNWLVLEDNFRIRKLR